MIIKNIIKFRFSKNQALADRVALFVADTFGLFPKDQFVRIMKTTHLLEIHQLQGDLVTLNRGRRSKITSEKMSIV